MTVSIEIEDRTVIALKAQAAARGLSLEEFLELVAGGTQPTPAVANESGERSSRDFDAALDDLFAADVNRLPASPLTYSRDDICHDHD